MKFAKKLLSSIFIAGALVGAAQAQEIVRDPAPNKFPISTSVVLPPEATIYYLSGVVPPKVSDGNYGANTQEQTENVLKSIEERLKKLNLTLSDVVKMQVFLVGDPKLDGKMDFAGFMEGYKKFFGTTEQPNMPSRSAMQVAALANPVYLVEIEVVAAKVQK